AQRARIAIERWSLDHLLDSRQASAFAHHVGGEAGALPRFDAAPLHAPDGINPKPHVAVGLVVLLGAEPEHEFVARFAVDPHAAHDVEARRTVCTLAVRRAFEVALAHADEADVAKLQRRQFAAAGAGDGAKECAEIGKAAAPGHGVPSRKALAI